MGSRNERFHGKMRGKTVRGRGYVKLPMNDGAMETVECMWVDIWCMLDWIIGLSQDGRNAFPWHGFECIK